MKSHSSRLAISLLAVALLLGACSSTPTRAAHSDRARPLTETAADDGPTAQELFLQGNAFLDQREWTQAIEAYDQALGVDGSRWEVAMNKAIAHSAANQFELAIEEIEYALDHGGDNKPELYFNLGNIYMNRGLYSQAIDAYRHSLAVRGSLDVDTLLNIGAAYAILNNLDSARITLEKTAQIAPDDPRPLHGLALLLQLEEKYDEAIVGYERIHAMAPDFAMSHFNRGFALLKLRRPADAIGAFERYLELDPQGPYVERARRTIKRAQQYIEK